MEKFDYTGRQAPRDDSLEIYRIGGRVSHFVPLTASGGTRAELNAESLDLLVGFPTPSKEEEESVFGDVRVSLFTSGGAVFLILTTPTFTVDFSVNILCMKAEAIGHWLSSRSCAVKLILVDSSDMTLRALRLLELPLMGDIRTVARQQMEMSMAQVDCSIREAMRQYTPMDMERMCSAKCDVQPIRQNNRHKTETNLDEANRPCTQREREAIMRLFSNYGISRIVLKNMLGEERYNKVCRKVFWSADLQKWGDEMVASYEDMAAQGILDGVFSSGKVPARFRDLSEGQLVQYMNSERGQEYVGKEIIASHAEHGRYLNMPFLRLVVGAARDLAHRLGKSEEYTEWDYDYLLWRSYHGIRKYGTLAKKCVSEILQDTQQS